MNIHWSAHQGTLYAISSTTLQDNCLPTVILPWNQLPASAVSAESLDQFKNKLRPLTLRYFNFGFFLLHQLCTCTYFLRALQSRIPARHFCAAHSMTILYMRHVLIGRRSVCWRRKWKIRLFDDGFLLILWLITLKWSSILRTFYSLFLDNHMVQGTSKSLRCEKVYFPLFWWLVSCPKWDLKN